MHLWHPGEEYKAVPVLNTRCCSVPSRVRRRKAERDGDGPGVPQGTGLFLLISSVTSRGTAQGSWQIITCWVLGREQKDLLSMGT